MSGLERLGGLRKHVQSRIEPLPAPYPAFVLILSISDGERRASVLNVTGGSFECAWQKLLVLASQRLAGEKLRGRWLRVDWPDAVQRTTVGDLRRLLGETKRNYFRLGLSLDEGFERPILEQELNGNAMLYGGNTIENAVLNERNFSLYVKSRFGGSVEPDFSEDDDIWAFATQGVFLDENERIHPLAGKGLETGRRAIGEMTGKDVDQLIRHAGTYLAGQLKPDGGFIYGYHPCFDREIPAYNTLRHASTTYSMIEAFELNGDAGLMEAIERSLARLAGYLIRQVRLPDGTDAAFLVDVGGEIKLGGNAVALLALAKYTSVTGSDRYDQLMEKLAIGIVHMQDPETGAFRHVLRFPELSAKADFRTVYYDGEATFALMRLHGLTQDPRWIAAVEKAFGHFLREDYARHHDHWLGYCANELTLFRPEERYFRFSIENVSSYLGFVANRITTFPTLLELMMATRHALTRIGADPAFAHLLDEIDLSAFEAALEKRAHHLLNGHFFPEVAMFMRNPNRILGAFYIRHQAFRVRIDDVEHYLSGLVAYRRYLDERESFRDLVRRHEEWRRGAHLLGRVA